MTNRITRLVVGLIASLGASLAWAGAGVIETVVTPLDDPFSYSDSGSPGYVGYSVAIRNTGGNTVNNIVFNGTTVVNVTPAPPANQAPTAPYFPTVGTACSTTNSAKTAIRCTIGQLTAGASFPVFYVYFTSPEKLPNTTATVSFSGQTLYAEGTGGLKSKPENSIGDWTARTVALGTASPTNITTGLPKVTAALSFKTAPNLSATDLADQITTKVKVPGTADLAASGLKLLIAEGSFNDPDCINGGNFKQCYYTQLTISGLEFPQNGGKYIEIKVLIGPAAQQGGIRVDRLRLTYDGQDIYYPLQDIGSCQETSESGATIKTYASLPCVLGEPVVLKNKQSSPEWTPELDGYLLATILNFRNGLIALR